MKRSVRVSPAAREDLTRLAAFVRDRAPDKSGEVRHRLHAALAGLSEFPERGPVVDQAAGIRELRVRLGRYGYVIQYRVDEDAVFVAHLYHAREQR
ncbi:MAG: hypothetical protein DI570_24640 [Phenylobacterium zucineum]|nr:MAG: hypothetical protein DI570_24640 [Phenylobacterium zucineum]